MGKSSREKQERRLQTGGEKEIYSQRRPNLEKVYFLIIEWGTYVSLFTPFILMRGYFFPYVVPKTIFFRIIVDIIFIAYVLLAISNPRYRPKINVLTISIIVFLGIVILTSFTGINLERSFWSTFERMTGILTFFHLSTFFIILTSCFKERKYWERILTVAILVGVLISFYTLLNREPFSRGGGTIGNVSFLASYLLFDIFFAIILLFTKRGGWKVFYGVTLAIMLLPLFFNIEIPRGSIGSFFIGIFLLGLSYMIFSGKKLLKRLAPVVFLLIVLIGIGVVQTDFFKAKMFDVKEIPGQAREIVWKITIDAWKAKPWLGWGQENFNVAFTKYFDSRIPLNVDIWYDRVHNVVLDTLISSGIVGLISYLAIFTVAIISLLKICPKVTERKNILLPLGMIIVLIVYFIQNIWVFDMISSYLMFFLSLAFIYFLIEATQPKVAPPEEQLKMRKISPFLGGLLIIITLFTLYFGNIQPSKSSHYTVLAVAKSLEESIPLFQKAIEFSPMAIFETPEQFSRKLTGLTFDESQNKEILKKAFGLAVIEMEKSIAKNPEEFRLYLLLGRHYNDFFYLTQDPEKLKQAEAILKKAIEVSPNNQQGYWGLAQTRIYQGRFEEAYELMQKSIDLEPQFSEPHWYLAMTYKIAGKNELALEKIKDAEEVGYPWKEDVGKIKKVIEIYQNLQDDKKLVELYPLAIEKDPSNAQFRAGLAVAYANLGQFDKARQYAKEAIALNPDFASQLEEFLRQLPK